MGQKAPQATAAEWQPVATDLSVIGSPEVIVVISTPGLECRNPGLNPGGRKLPGRQELRVAGRKLPGLKVVDRMAGRRLPGAREVGRRLTGAGRRLPGAKEAGRGLTGAGRRLPGDKEAGRGLPGAREARGSSLAGS